MAAFQAYAGAFTEEGETFRWNCYATCPVYEVRSSAHALPAAPEGRKWVSKAQSVGGRELAVLVDSETTDFSQMLTQITAAQAAALAF